MQQLTIITTYYNESDLLKRFLHNYNKIRNKFPVKLIIVDDGSQIEPAVKYIPHKLPGLSLYKVKEDLGFNSHGARNLGMQQSKSYWNFFTDIDNDIGALDFQKVFDLPYYDRDVYSFHTNSIIINKDVYWSCKGYDEDYVGVHYGDRYFLNYLETNFNFYHIKNNPLYKLRYGWDVVEVPGLEKDYYVGNTLYMKPLDHIRNKEIDTIIKERYWSNDFSSKSIINFDWEEVTCCES